MPTITTEILIALGTVWAVITGVFGYSLLKMSKRADEMAHWTEEAE